MGQTLKLSGLLLAWFLLLSGCQPAPPQAVPTDAPVAGPADPVAEPAGTLAPLPAEPAGDPLSEYPWLYQREPQSPDTAENTLSVIAVGDILLGRGVSQPEQAFASSAGWLSSADLTLGNLECVLTDHPITATATLSHSLPAPVRLFAETQAAVWLKQAGFDLLGLANNHSLDAGPSGLRHTAAVLQAAGLPVAGAGPTPEQALQAYLFTHNGVKLAVLSVNAIPIPPDHGLAAGQLVGDGWDIARWQRPAVLEAVQKASQAADAVIVSIHWGYEYQFRPDPAQERYAGWLFEAGADAVIGHHPHVVQAPALLARPDGRTVLAAYSLGNFVFDQGWAKGTAEGLALRMVFDRDGLLGVQALQVSAGSQPELKPPAPNPAPGEALHRAPQADEAAFQCTGLVCAPVSPPPGLAFSGGVFQAGAADLDGDGRAEDITLEGGRLRVHTPAGQLAWESPVEWLVVDAALGDPDWDGRPDLAAAFWKADPAGVLRSHPFLIRQNGGRYEEVWGGSAVSEPIWEIETADLNGDGLDELVVLAAAPAGTGQTLSVWEWHGWGFSQEWRSAAGHYENLQTAPGGWLKATALPDTTLHPSPFNLPDRFRYAAAINPHGERQ